MKWLSLCFLISFSTLKPDFLVGDTHPGIGDYRYPRRKF
jgi:hypothetical protein